MMLALIALMIAAGVSLLVLGMQPDSSRKIIQQRLYAEVAEEQMSPHRNLVRWLQPFVELNRKLRFGVGGSRAEENLVAGKVTLTTLEFMALRQLLAVVAVVIYMGSVGAGAVSPLWLTGAGIMGFMLPQLWLQQRIASRRGSIARDLPEIVDLLALSVEAGADFMGAMQRVVREFRPCPIKEELGIVLQEVRVGKRRREAFKSLANRVRMPEISGFSRTIIHADRMGTGMSDALKILSEDTRLRRYHAAERFAQQAPMKMLIPLIFVMFSVMIIVAGPILIKFIKGDLFPKF